MACIPLFTPEVINGVFEVYGHVETTGQRTRGCLVLDWLSKETIPGKSKLRILTGIDSSKFFDRISDSYN